MDYGLCALPDPNDWPELLRPAPADIEHPEANLSEDDRVVGQGCGDHPQAIFSSRSTRRRAEGSDRVGGEGQHLEDNIASGGIRDLSVQVTTRPRSSSSSTSTSSPSRPSSRPRINEYHLRLHIETSADEMQDQVGERLHPQFTGETAAAPAQDIDFSDADGDSETGSSPEAENHTPNLDTAESLANHIYEHLHDLHDTGFGTLARMLAQDRWSSIYGAEDETTAILVLDLATRQFRDDWMEVGVSLPPGEARWLGRVMDKGRALDERKHRGRDNQNNHNTGTDDHGDMHSLMALRQPGEDRPDDSNRRSPRSRSRRHIQDRRPHDRLNRPADRRDRPDEPRRRDRSDHRRVAERERAAQERKTNASCPRREGPELPLRPSTTAIGGSTCPPPHPTCVQTRTLTAGTRETHVTMHTSSTERPSQASETEINGLPLREGALSMNRITWRWLLHMDDLDPGTVPR